jgi:hypothetical protein
LPTTVEVAGFNSHAWDGSRDPAAFRYVRSAAEYGSFCQPTHTCAGDRCSGNPLGQATVTYDGQYATFPVTETIDTSDPGTTGSAMTASLTTSATWYAEYGAIRTARDPSGLETSVALDNLGRPTRMFGPGCPEPKAQIEYHLGLPTSYVYTRTNEVCDGDAAGISGDVMEAYAWVDGLGRARAAVSEGSPTDGLDGILSGVQVFDAKGAVQRAYLPCEASFPPTARTSSPPGCTSVQRPASSGPARNLVRSREGDVMRTAEVVGGGRDGGEHHDDPDRVVRGRTGGVGALGAVARCAASNGGAGEDDPAAGRRGDGVVGIPAGWSAAAARAEVGASVHAKAPARPGR